MNENSTENSLVAETATQIIQEVTKTINPASDIINDSSLRFILIPLAALFCVLILSFLVLMLARNRRRLFRIYQHRKQMSSFSYLDDDSDTTPLDAGDDIDDPTECLLKGKLQINAANKPKNAQRYDADQQLSSEFFT